MEDDTKLNKQNLIFYEVDVQNDFMNEEEGRLYVPEAKVIIPTIAEVVEFALAQGIRRIRSRDRHFVDDSELIANGGPFPEHCMDEQYGQQNKDGSHGIAFISELRTGKIHVLEYKYAENPTTPNGKETSHTHYYPNQMLDVIIADSQDIVLEKQDYDVFTNPSANYLLRNMPAKNAVVYGVATDYCVKAAVVGMQQRGIQCYVLEDAIRGITPETTRNAISEMKQSGAQFLKAKEMYKLVGGA